MGRDVAAPDARAGVLQGVAHVLLLGCRLLGLLLVHLHLESHTQSRRDAWLPCVRQE